MSLQIGGDAIPRLRKSQVVTEMSSPTNFLKTTLGTD